MSRLARSWPLLLALLPAVACAAPGIPAFSVQTHGGTQTYTLTLQVLALMTALTLLPAILLMMTAFTRIVIVLGILRRRRTRCCSDWHCSSPSSS